MIGKLIGYILRTNDGSNASNSKEDSDDLTKEKAADRVAQILRDLGFTREDVRVSYENFLRGKDLEEDRKIEEYILDNDYILGDHRDGETIPLREITRNVLRYSNMGVHTDFSYGEDQVQRKMSSALPEGLSLRLENMDGKKLGYWGSMKDSYSVDQGEEFYIILQDEEGEDVKTEFSYPENHYGKSSFDRLVENLNGKLLADRNFSFYQLKRFGDYWEFVLLKDTDAEDFRQEYSLEAQIGEKCLIEFS